MPDTGMPRFFADLSAWYAMEALAVGHALGLRAGLLQGPGTAAEIARRVGADERATTTWLWVAVAAGYAWHNEGVFEADPDQAAFLAGTVPGVDTVALLDFVVAMGARVPAVVEILRTGAAPDPGLFGQEFGRAVARVTAPLYAEALVGEWLAADPELTAALTDGRTVVDLACGDGTAVRVMAESFPRSVFVGVDRDEGVLGAAADAPPGNVSFGTSLPPSFDALTILDSFHHFAEPDDALAEIRTGLTPGGVLVIAESAYSGDPDIDAASPFGVIGLASALLYCDVEGRTGSASKQIAPRDGGVELRRALAAAGFATVTTHEGAGGYRVYFAR
jgi:SAM-dependent methyltransferase